MPGGRLVVTPQPEQPGCDYLLSAFTLLDNDGGDDVDTTWRTWRTVASASPVKRITTGGGTDIPKKSKKKQSGSGSGPGSGLGLGSRRGVGLEVGDKVEVNYEGMGAYYPGVITSCSNNDDNGGGVCYDIRYDDGDTESNVPFDMIKRLVPDNHQQPSQQQQQEEEGEGSDDENDNANDNDNQAAINISALSHPSTPQRNSNFNFNPSSSRGFSPTSGANPTQPMRLRDEDGRVILVPGLHKLTVVFKPDDERWVSST